MRNHAMKRFLALLLCAAMLLSCAWAEETDTPANQPETLILAEESAPAVTEDASPAEEPKAPADDNAAPSEKDAAPAEEDAAPAEEDAASAEEDAAPAEAEPLPEVFEGSVSAVLRNDGGIHEGDTLVYAAKITGNAGLVTIRWQMKTVNEETGETEWKDLAAGERFTLTATEENLAKSYRVALYDAEGSLCASAALRLPEITVEDPAAEEEAPAESEPTGGSGEPEAEAEPTGGSEEPEAEAEPTGGSEEPEINVLIAIWIE